MDSTQKLLRKYHHEVLRPDAPAPLYHQLYAMLRDCIVGGVLEDGALMPSEKELSLSFKVSRITARRALHELVAEKLVTRHRGRGTFVNCRYRPEMLSAPINSVLDSLEQMGRETKIKVLSLRFIHPPAAVLDEFALGEDQPLCHIVRVRSNQTVLFAYYESWSRGLNRGSVAKRELEKHPRLELLRRSGLKIARGEQTLSAQAAPPVVSDALGVTPGKPLLKLIRRCFDKNGRQLDRLDAFYNPDHFQYHMTFAWTKGDRRPSLAPPAVSRRSPNKAV